ncbi:MAG: hypothetical protein AAF591_08805 [Verrucomicrobiota bacterium]
MKCGVTVMVIGVVLLLAGVVVYPIIVVVPSMVASFKLEKFLVPGNFEAVVQPGRHYLWHNYKTTYNGKSYLRDEELPEGFVIVVRDGNGRELKLSNNTTIVMSRPSAAKKSVGHVEVERAGRVFIAIEGEGPECVLSFGGQSSLSDAFRPGSVKVIVGVLGCGVGLTICGFVQILRSGRSTS